MKIIKDKKGAYLAGVVIFIILNLVFFSLMFFVLTRTTSGASFYEQASAKQIAILIDSAKPGTTITADISELMDKAEENNFQIKNIIFLDNKEKLVRAQASNGGGYTFYFFSDNEAEIKAFDEDYGTITIYIKESG